MSCHLQANGLVQRVDRQLKDALRARGAGVDWPFHLYRVFLGIRAVPKEISASVDVIFGQPLFSLGSRAWGSSFGLSEKVGLFFASRRKAKGGA